MKPTICPTCKQIYTDPANIEAIKYFSVCLSCDHLRGNEADMQWANEDNRYEPKYE